MNPYPYGGESRGSIGSATMTGDETIILDLRTDDDGIRADARLVYPRSHPRYQYILDHVGPLEPGGAVHVRPFPPENVA